LVIVHAAKVAAKSKIFFIGYTLFGFENKYIQE